MLFAGDVHRLGYGLDAVKTEADAELSVHRSGPDLLDAVLSNLSRQLVPDVVILDDDLDGYGGLNMAATLRRAGYRSAIYLLSPVVRAMRVAAAARRLDARVVQRPVSADVLLAAIARARLVARPAPVPVRRDRRRWPRVPVRLTAELRDGHHSSYTGVISDVSLAGMMIHVDLADAVRLRVGRSIAVAFDADRLEVCLPCVVRRRGDPLGRVELGVRLRLEDSDSKDCDVFGRWLFARVEAYLRDRARAIQPQESPVAPALEPSPIVAQLG